MAEFSDHFSGHAAIYAAARPGYPAQLFEALRSWVVPAPIVLEVAAGSGQATAGLATFAGELFAVEPSRTLLAQGKWKGLARPIRGRAEALPLASGSVDLVAVAQAYHWFTAEDFLEEAQRVLRPGGSLAVWGYGEPEVEAVSRALLKEFHDEIVGRHWPPRRAEISSAYRDLPWPAEGRRREATFRMEMLWERKAFLAYLGTWSGVKRAEAAGEDPLAWLRPRLEEAWTDGTKPHIVNWPVFLKFIRFDADANSNQPVGPS